MNYDKIVEGIFIKRLNRFVAKVLINGVEETVHVKNTGRCKELLIEGVKVYLQESDNVNRKTKYSLISVYKGDTLINMDSQIPNYVVYEGILNNQIEELKDVDYIKKEVTYGNSRFDIYYEKGNVKGFIEVKGVTLEVDKKAKFPDAPTLRGSKHLKELVKGSKEGYTNYIFFLIQMDGVYEFSPNNETDPKFASELINANSNNVQVLCYDSKVTRNSIVINKKIVYNLN
jgi:sugar fermentation stimulation protein A